jgi:hypothetical protein
MNRQMADYVRKLIDANLANIERHPDVNGKFKFNLGHGTYNETAITFKLEVIDKSATGGIEDKNEIEWNKLSRSGLLKSYGFEHTDLHRKLNIEGKQYEIIGWASRSKYPVVTRRNDGKILQWRVENVLQAIKKEKGSLTNIWYHGGALSPQIKAELEQRDAFRSGRARPEKIRFQQDESGNVTDWVVAMDDGGYYKVNAKFMIWTKNAGSRAAWSERLMDLMVSAYMDGRTMPQDPDYQT